MFGYVVDTNRTIATDTKLTFLAASRVKCLIIGRDSLHTDPCLIADRALPSVRYATYARIAV
jgi:hypothetical protein